jgi:hypothetical protein
VSREKNRRNAGWFVGAGLFWLIAIWLITVSLSAIIPQVFREDGAGAPTNACGPSLVTLKGELLGRLTDEMTRVGDDRTELVRWLSVRDARLAAMTSSCGKDGRKAMTELARLRHGLYATVLRLDREQAPRIRKIDTLLGHSPAASMP